ncbi:MAG: hypothetical protein IT458_03805 [Planctomycetes bacterium]|nr:hypothetical protein [Planctomycetota bacterium]
MGRDGEAQAVTRSNGSHATHLPPARAPGASRPKAAHAPHLPAASNLKHATNLPTAHPAIGNVHRGAQLPTDIAARPSLSNVSRERHLPADIAARLALAKANHETHLPTGAGQFGRLFADHEDAVAKPMEFSRQWAARLMKLAAHPTIGNVNHGLHLPSDINALDMLARLSESEVAPR